MKASRAAGVGAVNALLVTAPALRVGGAPSRAEHGPPILSVDLVQRLAQRLADDALQPCAAFLGFRHEFERALEIVGYPTSPMVSSPQASDLALFSAIING
jgi:hypothetical protein